MKSAPCVHLAIQQPALPAYRVPFFRLLSTVPGLKISVTYGKVGNLANADASGFVHKFGRTKIFFAGTPFEVWWDQSQLRLVSQEICDVVVLGWSSRYLSLVPALLLARLNRVPVILWGHGYSKKSGVFATYCRNSLCRLASAVIVYDEDTQKKLQDEIPHVKVFAAPNAIDQISIQESRKLVTPVAYKEFRSNNNLIGRDVVLFVSRLEESNEIEQAIRALVRVSKRRPSVLLVLIGGGTEAYEQSLDNLINELDLGPWVRRVGSIYCEHELAYWFSCAKMFCYPTNIGLSLMHAFGYGLPAVIGDDFSRCNPEIYAFQDGVNGMLYADGDVSALANCLETLLSDDKLQRRLSQGALDTVASVASLDNMVAGFAGAVFSTVNAKNSN